MSHQEVKNIFWKDLVRGGVVTQQRLGTSFWKDLGWFCDAGGDEKQFLEGFREEL